MRLLLSSLDVFIQSLFQKLLLFFLFLYFYDPDFCFYLAFQKSSVLFLVCTFLLPLNPFPHPLQGLSDVGLCAKLIPVRKQEANGHNRCKSSI